MKEVPSFDIELSQAIDYIMSSPLAEKAFSKPPFPQYTNILRVLIQNIDRLADNCHMPEFTNHALPHICSIVRRASEWAVSDNWLKEITEQEAAYLLLALIVHDIGMLSQDAHDLPDEDKQSHMKGFSDISNWVRRTHVIRLEGLVLRLLSEEIDNAQRKEQENGNYDNDITLKDHIMVVTGMAKSHQCWEWDSKFITNIEYIQKVGLKQDRVAALNSIIAVCDLLDEDSNRCDTIALIKYRHGTMENLAHWIRHALTVSVDGVKNHTVTVTFRRLIPSDNCHEKIYRALRNHYRLVKLYNKRLATLQAEIHHIKFDPSDGIPELNDADAMSKELSEIWTTLPEFKNHIVEQILSTFMPEALNQENGNAGMRQRLDELGLETIDLSDERLFIEPPTIYFPDEKILFKKGHFLEQLAYIKEQVDTAYLDGNIGKLHHLCLTALTNWKSEESLNNTYWIFVYIAIFQKSGDDIRILNYDNSLLLASRPSLDSNLRLEGPYQPLLDVLLLLLYPRFNGKWNDIYLNHVKGKNYSDLKDDIPTQILLETILGLLWYYDQDGTIWLDMFQILYDRIPVCLQHKLINYKSKLQKMCQILNPKSSNIHNMCQNYEQTMERAWIDFWNQDWEKQEQIIPKLCHLGNYDSDLMEPIQGYLNLVRQEIEYQIEHRNRKLDEDKKTPDAADISNSHMIQKTTDNSSQRNQESVESQSLEGEKFDDNLEQREERAFQKKETRTGFYRYNRIISEQPLPIFWQQRKTNIDLMIADCRRRKNDSQNIRINLIPLIALHILDSIRYWNLWQYIDGIRSLTVIEYLNGTYVDKRGDYCGDKYALRDCFVDYMKGLDSKGLTKEEKRIAAKMLVCYAPEELDYITDFIVNKSMSIQWKYALDVIEVFAKYYPIEQRKKLLYWLPGYHSYYKDQNRFFDMSQYQFITCWALDMENEDWNIIREIIDEIFESQVSVMTNTRLVECVFKFAPWEWCIRYLMEMKKFPENVRKSCDYYSAIITMVQREDFKKKENQEVKQRKDGLNEILNSLVDDVDIQLEKISLQNNTDDATLNDKQSEIRNLKRMKSLYEEIKILIDVDKLDHLDAIDLSEVENVLMQLEESIEKRGNLSGYDTTFMNPVHDTFLNKNWKVKDEERLKKIVDFIFEILIRYKDTMSLLFFSDFCNLFYLIENTCSFSVCEYINHLVINNMVRADFLPNHRKKTVEQMHGADGPYKTFRFDDGSHNQYEISVALLLVKGMTALIEEEQYDAIMYMTRLLALDEDIIYNYATVMFSYFFLKKSTVSEDEKADADIAKAAWGGLQFILGRVTAERKYRNVEVDDEISMWIQKAIDAMEESDLWFSPQKFIDIAEKNAEYMEWLDAIGRIQ